MPRRPSLPNKPPPRTPRVRPSLVQPTTPQAPEAAPWPRDVLSPQEASQRLGLSLVSVLRFLRDGRLPGVKIGRRWFIHTAEIDRKLAGKR